MHKKGVQRMASKSPPDNDVFQAAASGNQAWLLLSLRRALCPSLTDKQGLTVLHVAALHGHLDCLRLLLESRALGVEVDVNACCPRGRRPLHMAVSSQSRPQSLACLTYLLEHGALPNVSTQEGLTPLHFAVTEGLLDCTVALVQAGADTSAHDSRGHTPIDLARIWGYRAIARFLKDGEWKKEKQRQMERQRELLTLRRTLVRTHKQLQEEAKASRQKASNQRVEEWARRKGLPPLQPVPKSTLSRALSPRCRAGKEPSQQHKSQVGPKDQGAGLRADREAWNISPNPSKPPPGIISLPQGVRMTARPEAAPSEPDLRGSVTLIKGSHTVQLDGATYQMPALPWDMVQRTLFPNAYPSRISSPLQFCPTHVLDLPRLCLAPCPGDSPWTEVAMHLAETLEPGSY
ncbi:hypothetical protein AGOR_G00184410 [Albula goreensis]|uniref:Ankyrin repeat domain-containing protein 53 n=1 Tax=Albula goreensis TaxID=1534307 RepID=A0A8T3CWF8_9TELE|nr:hypothetical protein AGOR_G00184410 [Albula goreensis]